MKKGPASNDVGPFFNGNYAKKEVQMDNILSALGMCIIAASIIFASHANVAITRALLEKEPASCVCVASPNPEGENNVSK